MSTISVSLPSDGDTIDVADYNTPINTIVNAINGGLDNANIKTAAAITGSKIADATVTNSKLSLDATTWTPTLGNLSGGTLNYARYTEIGDRVFCEFKYTLGGAGMGTAPTITLPVAPAAHYVDNDIISHNVLLSETGAQDYYGLARISQTSDLITLYVQQASGTYLNTANITSAVPFTWGSTDIVRVSWSYEKA
jgi:hypothetical protein